MYLIYIGYNSISGVNDSKDIIIFFLFCLLIYSSSLFSKRLHGLFTMPHYQFHYIITIGWQGEEDKDNRLEKKLIINVQQLHCMNLNLY